MNILDEETGPIVGDAIRALVDIGAEEAKPKIQELVSARDPWTSQQARHALKVLR